MIFIRRDNMTVSTQYEILVNYLKILVEKNEHFIQTEKIIEILQALEEK